MWEWLGSKYSNATLASDKILLVKLLKLIVLWGMWLSFECVIFKCIVVITSMSISTVIAYKWIAQDPTDDKSALVQVMTCGPFY